MFEKILVALDRSPEAGAVFNFALSLAQPKSELLLVHFIDWQMQDVSPWVGVGTLYDLNLSGDRYWSHQRLETEVEIVNDWLKAIAEPANQRGVRYKYECQIGNCNLGIGDRAKNWGADVIVIGRRNQKNISEIFLGSVSNYVIHHTPCSVLVVQGTNSSTGDRLAPTSEVNYY